MSFVKDKRIRLCFFESAPPFGERLGGIPTYILHRAHILTKHNFTIYWTDGFRVGVFDGVLKKWKIIEEFKTSKFKKKIISRFPYLLPGIKFLLNDIKIDLIEFPDSYGYNIKSLQEKCKVVIQCHTSSPVREFLNDLKPGLRSRINTKRIRKNFYNADRIIACSFEIALLTSGFYKIHLDRFNVIPHALVKELLIFKEANNDFRENYFLVVSNVEYLKSIDLLLKAFIEYKNRGGKCKLYYVGPKDLFDVPPPMNKKWVKLGTDKLIAQLNKEDFEFVPYLKKQEVLNLMSKASATIVLSRFEAFTMVVGEAASVGCPLIISNRTGWNNLINKFSAGLLVNPYDKDEVANAMLKMENILTSNNYSENIEKLFKYLNSDDSINQTLEFYKL